MFHYAEESRVILLHKALIYFIIIKSLYEMYEKFTTERNFTDIARNFGVYNFEINQILIISNVAYF